MLSKNKRIPRQLFKKLLKSRNYFNSEHFSLRVVHSLDARVSVSVSKKVSKKAVTRNKVRRRVYSFFSKTLSSLSPNLYLIVAKPGSDKIKNEVLVSEINSLVVNCRL